MRKTLIAGNWKMNTDRAAAVALAKGVAAGAAEAAGVDLVVCPPTIYLAAVGEALAGSPVSLGAQNVYAEDNGAFTGETSTAMLKDVGAKYVILGHSERRTLMGETDADVCKKTHKALAAGLTPIVCVGELLEERESGKTAEVIKTQFEGSLEGITADQITSIVIAYEPVWAIGTGKTPTTPEVAAAHAHIRKVLGGLTGEAAQVRLLYGGSVKGSNAAELLAAGDVDGALVGGASLKADEFLAIAKAA
jgi:triosephosphate isomerase